MSLAANSSLRALWGFPGGSVGKRTCLLIQELHETWVRSLGREDSPREGNDNPLLYSCLENLMDRGIWQATVHRVAKSQTRLSEHRAEHSGFPKDTQSCALSVHKHDNQAPGIPTQERGGKYRPIA